MASIINIIKVDTIQTAAGGTPTAADLGLNTTGSVLQVVQAQTKTASQVASTTWTATNSTISITPSSASSKILIMTNAALYAQGDDFHIYTSIHRDGTSVTGDADPLQLHSAGYTTKGRWTNGSMHYLDAPNTTSSTTYTVYFKSLGGTVNYGNGSEHCVITAMEIAG